MASRNHQTDLNSNDEFVPQGAIAFFVAMLIAFAVIWAGLYLLLVQRQLWI